MSLVSFIVPVYNVEGFVEACIHSIANQTCNDIEIIAVDDGSTDKSGQILDALAKNDSRIIAIHQENRGVSAARNVGLSQATGEYILFVDGDDYVDNDYAECFLGLIRKTDTDLALSTNWFIDNQLEKNEKYRYLLYDGGKAIEHIYLDKIAVGVPNKIYKREFLQKIQAVFHEEYWFAEGMTFNIECMIAASKIGVSDFAKYHYVTNPQSATRKFNYDSFLCGLHAMDYQKNKWNAIGNNRLRRAYNYHRHNYNWHILLGVCQTNSEMKFTKEIRICKKNIRKDFWKVLVVSVPLRRKILALIGLVSPTLALKMKLKRMKEREIEHSRREKTR